MPTKPLSEIIPSCLTPVNDVWDERALSELMSRGGDGPVVFLNLDKRCEKPEVTQPLESVRLSQLLSFGGLLVSQRSNPTDEAAYEGLVTFAPRASLQQEVTALLRRGNLSEIARERAALFQQRFLPEVGADALEHRVDGDLDHL